MIIAGSASKDLAEKISVLLKEQLVRPETKKFPDGEIYIRLREKIEEPVIVVQGLHCPQNDHLVELLFILKALKQKGIKKIACVIPYYAYARQDKIFAEGEIASSEVIAELLRDFSAKFVVTCDLHFNRKEGGFSLHGIDAYNVTASDLLVDYIKKEIGDVIIFNSGSSKRTKQTNSANG